MEANIAGEGTEYKPRWAKIYICHFRNQGSGLIYQEHGIYSIKKTVSLGVYILNGRIPHSFISLLVTAIPTTPIPHSTSKWVNIYSSVCIFVCLHKIPHCRPH